MLSFLINASHLLLSQLDPQEKVIKWKESLLLHDTYGTDDLHRIKRTGLVSNPQVMCSNSIFMKVIIVAS